MTRKLNYVLKSAELLLTYMYRLELYQSHKKSRAITGKPRGTIMRYSRVPNLQLYGLYIMSSAALQEYKTLTLCQCLEENFAVQTLFL